MRRLALLLPLLLCGEGRPPVAVALQTDDSVKMLFVDEAVLTNKTSGFRFTINRPVTDTTAPAISADRPWESWGLDLYATVVRDPAEPAGSPRAWRMYYTSLVSASYRRFMCLALSVRSPSCR